MGRKTKWTAAQESELGTMIDKDFAAKHGYTKNVVLQRRSYLKIPAYDQSMANQRRWSDQDIALLGTMTDVEASKIIGRTAFAVTAKRIAMGIDAHMKVIDRRASLPEWQYISNIPQDKFFKIIIAALAEFKGRKITYSTLAEMTHYSLSRVQKWATSGTAQEPLSLPTRHHFYLAALAARKTK